MRGASIAALRRGDARREDARAVVREAAALRVIFQAKTDRRA